MLTLQDNPTYSTNHFDVIELDSSSGFSYLLVFKSYTGPTHWLKTEKIFHDEFSGKVLLDRVLHVGNSKDRFIIYTVNNGIIQNHPGEVAELTRKNYLRVLSNSVLRGYPELVSNSILSSVQKKLLLQGLSI